MSDVCIKLKHKITQQLTYGITLNEPVVIMCDNSGTGKIAFCNQIATSSSIYYVELLNAKKLMVIQYEDDVEDMSRYIEVDTVIVIDEDSVELFADKIYSYLGTPKWHFLIITRDSNVISHFNGHREKFITRKDSVIVNVPNEPKKTEAFNVDII